MTDQPNPVAIMVQRLANDLRSEWADIVAVSVRILREKETVDQVSVALAKVSRVGVESIKRKIVAVQKMHQEGFTEEEIVQMGQEQCLGHFIKERRQESYEKQVWIKFKVQGSQREIVLQQIERVKKVLGLTTSEQFFDWFYAQLWNTTDEELKHSAGVSVPKKDHETQPTRT